RRDLGRATFAGEILMPALVNAHVHLELSALRGRLPAGKGLIPWVRALLAVRATLDPAEVAAAVARALEELRAAGVGAVCDVTSGFAPIPYDARLGGVRFHEALGARPEEAAAALEAARRMSGDGPLAPALAAHSPATCSARLLEAIALASA